MIRIAKSYNDLWMMIYKTAKLLIIGVYIRLNICNERRGWDVAMIYEKNHEPEEVIRVFELFIYKLFK